jgi:transcriptional regulator with XRE-family HTH domain
MKRKDNTLPNEQLQRERMLHGWTQRDVAGCIGADGYTVNRWERGRAIPSPYFRQKLCELFGKSAEELGFLGKSTPINKGGPTFFPGVFPAKQTAITV